MFPRYFRYSIGSTVEFTGTGGDRSINSPFTCYVNKSSLLKNEKKKKKRNSEMIGEEGDKNAKTKEK